MTHKQESNAYITSEQITIDIKDTKIDITNLEKEIKGHELIASSISGPQSRMASFRVDGKQIRLNEMREFVIFLETLLNERGSVI